MTDPLEQAAVDRLITLLRTGRTPDDAAFMAGVPVGEMYAAARAHPDLAVALAGEDPYAGHSEGMMHRAEYLRLLALGCTPTLAAMILFNGDGRVSKMRQKHPWWALACDAVEGQRTKRSGRRSPNFTPDRVGHFLEELRNGAGVNEACRAVGITSAAVYQRRRRDRAFARAMDQAREGATRAHGRKPTETQWALVLARVEHGVTLRRAALDAGLRPGQVYIRRRDDSDFRAKTDAMGRRRPG